MTDIWLPPHLQHLREPLTVRCSRCPWTWHGHREQEGVLALAQHQEHAHAPMPSPQEFSRGLIQQQILDQAYAPEDAYGKKALPLVKGLTDTAENREDSIVEQHEDIVVERHKQEP